MHRDMDLVRAILLKASEQSEEQGRQQWMAIDGYDSPTVARHVELMKEAGLVEAHVPRADGVAPQMARVFRLTWTGHDFLDSTRNASVWAKTKAFIAEKGGGASFEVVKAVAISFTKAQLGLTSD